MNTAGQGCGRAGIFGPCRALPALINKTVEITFTSVRLYTKYEAGARKWLAKLKGWKQGKKLAWLGPNTMKV